MSVIIIGGGENAKTNIANLESASLTAPQEWRARAENLLTAINLEIEMLLNELKK